MTFSDIVDVVVAKIGKDDDYTRARCLEFVYLRHKQIWDSLEWTATKDIQSVTVSATQFDISNAEKIISARFDGAFIDPVTPSFIFESHPELIDATGKPIYYWSHYNGTSSSLEITLYPGIDPAGSYVGKTLDLLVKKGYDGNVTTTQIPNTENALIAFVLADMWEMLRQLSKYKEKLEEAKGLLADAQAADSPSVPRPRASKSLTVNGSTVTEMTDSVCDILGKWEPDIRESIKDRIRRNYDLLWNSALWPETIIIADAEIDLQQRQIVLPYLFDKVLEVRTNEGGPLTQVTRLKDAELPYLFGIKKDIFEQSGEPVFYNLLPSVAVSMLPQGIESIQAWSDAANTGGPLTRYHHGSASDEGVEIFVKGERDGVEQYEILRLPVGGEVPGPLPFSDPDIFAFSVNSYDSITTISKPVTNGNVQIIGSSSLQSLLILRPEEMERKHIRIEIHPNFESDGATDDAGSVLVCGKRRLSPLVDDNDSPQLRDCANILIAAAAADMFDKLGQADMAAKYSQKAAAMTQVLVKGETEQAAHQPKVVPYTEAWYQPRRVSSTFP